jgi:DNA-directed RNA polymerase specialized sigma24 family protein
MSASAIGRIGGSEILEAGDDDIEALLAQVAPGLQRALIASFGREVGGEATIDALAWAWTRRRRALALGNPGSYLYRVGASFARRSIRRAGKQRERDRFAVVSEGPVPDGGEPKLTPALAHLSPQQRGAVVLVHGYGFTLADAAESLGCSVSSLRNHLDRGMTRLRTELGVDL